MPPATRPSRVPPALPAQAACHLPKPPVTCAARRMIRSACRMSDVARRLPDVGRRLSNVAHRVPDVGCRMSRAGCRTSDAGCRMSHAGCRTPDVDCRMSRSFCRSSSDSRHPTADVRLPALDVRRPTAGASATGALAASARLHRQVPLPLALHPSRPWRRTYLPRRLAMSALLA